MTKTKRNIIIFICVSLAGGWLGVLIDSVLTEQPEGDSLGMGIWLVLPVLTAVILRIVSHDKNGLGLKPNFKGNLKWYAFAVLLYPLITLVCIGLAAVFGCLKTTGFSFIELMSLALSSMLYGFVKNIFEEFSWRGYLTTKLVEIRLNDWFIYLISGLVWGLWHSAYYLVFLPDTYFETTLRAEMLIIGCVLMTVWSIMYTEILRLTKSVWPCVILHAAEDAVPTAVVTVSGFVTFAGYGDLLLNPTTGIVATVVFLVTGLLLRRIRRKAE